MGFYNYLLTPAAGFHKERNRLQHATQVRTILNENDITFLGHEEGTRVWLDWVIPNLKAKAGGTLKSYLGSLQKFLEFTSKRLNRPNLPVLPEDTRDAFEDLAKDLKGWRRTITKETSKDSWKRYLQECDNLLTSSEVDAIMTSQPAIKGRQAFTAAQANEELSEMQYCAARDLLIMLCTKAVGSRPGALENATLHTYHSAKWDSEHQKKIMLVTAHKREEDGPAPLALDPETAFLMEVFIEKVRPTVTDDKSPSSFIFLKSDGQPFPHGRLGRRIASFTVKSGVRSNAQITATDFRKWIVTTMHAKKQQGEDIDEDLLRRLMCHSDKTARKWYVRQSLTKGAAKAAAQIEKNTRASPRKRPANSQPEGQGPSPEKRALTDAEDNAIKQVFQSSIEKNEELTKDIVAKITTDATLKNCLQSPSLLKKGTDRYRYLKRVEPRLEPQELPVEDKEDRTKAFVFAPSVSSVLSSSREDWSKEDTNTILEALQPYQECPRNAEIRQLFKSTPALQNIFDNNSFDRVRNKVKNIMRKKHSSK